jgi:hypothetical protein
MYLTLEWEGELLYFPVRDIHQSGMVVVEGPEGEQYLCIPAGGKGKELEKYNLKLLEDDLLLRHKPDPFRLSEAQEYLNTWDGTELTMPVTFVTPAKS